MFSSAESECWLLLLYILNMHISKQKKCIAISKIRLTNVFRCAIVVSVIGDPPSTHSPHHTL